jgi:glycosyltransferase involved in cell wall biosynthesis
MSERASDLMREVVFFDSFGQDRGRRRPLPLSRNWWREWVAAPFGLPVMRVPITGKVESRNFRGRLPAFDRVLNVPDLFATASRYFRRTGQFLPIRVPDTPAIMHWTYPLPIRVIGARNVYTIHDMVPLRLPYTTLDDKGYHIRLIRGCLRHGARICTVSEASRQDIETFFPQATGHVVNTYQSVVAAQDALAVPEVDLQRWLAGVYGLEFRGYFLYFGALEPKKNISRMLDAYLSSACTAPLVLVGGRAWKSEREAEIIAKHKSIEQIDYVPFGNLTRLIRGAKAVVFPSLSEGFGLPVIEAMALGTPVLTSKEGSLPEIAGAAALLVDAYDVDDIADGLRRLEDDAELCARLSASGVMQAGRFDLASYRQRLSVFYDELLSEPA